MHARIHGDITFPSASVPCIFVGECTEESFPRPLTPSLLSPFTNRRDYGGRVLAAHTTNGIMITTNTSQCFFPVTQMFW